MVPVTTNQNKMASPTQLFSKNWSSHHEFSMQDHQTAAKQQHSISGVAGSSSHVELNALCLTVIMTWLDSSYLFWGYHRICDRTTRKTVHPNHRYINIIHYMYIYICIYMCVCMYMYVYRCKLLLGWFP